MYFSSRLFGTGNTFLEWTQVMLYKNEQRYRKYFKIIAGVDEAGRGPLAGPVIVAAVILNPDLRIEGLNDSKKLTEKKREELYKLITKHALDWKVVSVPSNKIDKINILQATLLGMEKAVLNLRLRPDICLIDGNKIPKKIESFSEAIIKGDGKFASIAAASIVAKVTRDRLMRKLHKKYPNYNFMKNKGYPTKEHLEAIAEYGITRYHRKSYRPIREFINSNK